MMLIIIGVVVYLVWQHFNKESAAQKAEVFAAEAELSRAQARWNALKENSTAVEIADALMDVSEAQKKLDQSKD